jgi:PAS domain S-box-containing protein
LLLSFNHRNLNSENASTGLLLGIPFDKINFQEDLNNIVLNPDGDRLKRNTYQIVFDNAIMGMILFDENGCVEEINQAILDQMGFDKEKVIGNSIEDIFSGELLNKVQALFKLVQKSKQQLVKDVISLRDEGGHRLFEISLSRFKGSDVNFDKTLMISEDITEQADTHAALIQSEKLALTGRLAASLAHEINNPLQTSIGCLGLVDEMLNDHERQDDFGVYISLALDELKRSARIVKKLRDLNRRTDPSEKTCVDLKEIIESVLMLTKNQLEDKSIIPTFQFEGKKPLVSASQDQLQQVLLNLVMNAIDAMPEGGEISIDLHHTEKPQGIEIDVKDSGHGMSKEVINRLFDPFFTTKDDGLGLGLFICKEIIEDHHGTLIMNSQVGQGTTFTIWLPKVQNEE